MARGTPYVVAATVSVACGVGLATLGPPIVVVLVPGLVIAVVVVSLLTWSRRDTSTLRGEHATAAVLVALGVVVVTWNGVRVGLGPFDILFGAAFVALGFSSLRGGKGRLLPGWLLLAGSGLLTGALLAELFVPYPPVAYRSVSQAYLNPSGQWSGIDPDMVLLGKLELALIAVPFLIGAVTASWRRARLVADLWLFSAVVSAGVASLDLLVGTRIGELATGIGTYEGRATGLAAHANHLGLASAMALPLALARATAPRRVGSVLGSVLGSAAAAVLVVGILASGSRTNLLGAIIGVTLLLLFLRGARAKLAGGVGAGVLLVLVGLVVTSTAGTNIVSFTRLAGENGAIESDSRRSDRLDVSLSSVRTHGLTGVGFATARDAHNLYLQMLQAGGIVALTGFVVFAVGALRLGRRLSLEPRAPPESARLAAALTVSLLVWLICGLFQNAVNDRYIFVPFGVLLGLSLAVHRQRSPAFRRGEPGRVAISLREPRAATEIG